MQRLGRRDDGDGLEGLQIEQVVVAGDDEIHLCGKRQGEHGIVIGIAADGRGQRHRLDDLGERPNFIERTLARSVRPDKDRIELRPRDNIGEFGEEHRAADQGQRAVADVLDQGVRRAVPEESGQQHVGINDRPHAVYVDVRRVRL